MKNLIIRPIPLYIGPTQTCKFTYMMNWQELTTVAGYVWYIEGAEKRILVDSGITIEAMLAMGSPRREKPQEIEEGLAKLGLRPEDIDIVIQTHLDRDHVELAPRFGNAKFIVQKKELEFALNPHPAIASRFFKKEFYKGLNFETIEGDQRIVTGVDVLFTPGHSPGTQSVAVETEKGRVIIAGFCCADINLWPPPEVAKTMPVIPPTVHTDLFEAYRSILRVKELADTIVAIHEPRFCWVNRIPDESSPVKN
jgi:N-acyl homoserine lactone hydrolase